MKSSTPYSFKTLWTTCLIAVFSSGSFAAAMDEYVTDAALIFLDTSPAYAWRMVGDRQVSGFMITWQAPFPSSSIPQHQTTV
jgi:hypothetical protein